MARNITVTFADGTSHTYQNAPDDVTPDAVEARASKEFGKQVTALDGGRNSAPKGPNAPNVIDRDTYLQQVQARKEAGPGFFEKGGTAQNVAGGLVRGAGSIGSTLLRFSPIDKVPEAIDEVKKAYNTFNGVSNKSLSDLVTGGKKEPSRDEVRREAMTNALRLMGVDTDSTSFAVGKIGGEIAGTAGAGGALAQTLGRVPVLANNAAPLLNAIRTSGMTTEATGGNALANLATRAGGGAISGGLQAGMVNPEDAATGAVIGGVLPVGLKIAGATGNKISSVLRGPAQAPETLSAVKAAQDVGYVIPPTQASPTLGNRLLEGMAGKLTTAQNASAKNATVTNSLAAKAIGLAPETNLTPEVLDNVRKSAGQAYEAVASLPVKPAQSANSLANTPAVAEINPKDMVFDLRKARNDATAWYNSYARTADPDSLVKAKTAQALANKLQTGLEDYATSIGRDDLVPAMVESRKLIAKTYTIEKALNPTTGTVDARKLGAMLDKGKPLSDELKQAAEFANRFPKAAQTVEKMGSLPQTSPLDWFAGVGMGAATQNPLALAAVAARPGARAAALSSYIQRGLSEPQSSNKLIELLSSPAGQQLLAKTAPIAGNRP